MIFHTQREFYAKSGVYVTGNSPFMEIRRPTHTLSHHLFSVAHEVTHL